jgi:hypothetical protein
MGRNIVSMREQTVFHSTDSATTVRLPFLSWSCHRSDGRILYNDEFGLYFCHWILEETYHKAQCKDLNKEATYKKSVAIFNSLHCSMHSMHHFGQVLYSLL